MVLEEVPDTTEATFVRDIENTEFHIPEEPKPTEEPTPTEPPKPSEEQPTDTGAGEGYPPSDHLE